MKFTINKRKLNFNIQYLLKRGGYVFFAEESGGQMNFVKRLGGGYYPRFHLYLDQTENEFIINLHLDQKKPSYAGSHAHNAEYSGEVVEQEIERLKNSIGKG